MLDEQYQRSALGNKLHFFPAVDDLEPVYARADALFLSSRLDPLPNVMIDAALRGIPVVCFDQASGAAELLCADPATACLVVPHLDSGAAADTIAVLARDDGLYESCSRAIRELAQRTFDMTTYARALHAIGLDAARKFENKESDARQLDEADAFSDSIYFGAASVLPSGSTAAATYVANSRHINFALAPVFGAILRRPRVGFHPFIYGSEAPDFPDDGSRDPLAHFIERGMPDGRWAHRVIRPDLIATSDDAAGSEGLPSGRAENSGSVGPLPSTVALHGHFHYAENIEDFLSALGANHLRADLFLTTTSDETAAILRSATANYAGGNVIVEVGPNVGRDIFAFLRVLREHVRGNYELVGHIHGKRSVHTLDFDPEFGDRWRHSLWEHLLGPSYRTADMIVDAMRQDETLGLVFPENGFLVGWEKNNSSAAALARRIGLQKDLPPHIEFPAGTMFWARTEALDLLVRAELREDEMPAEPIPIDGTLLHALERLLPLVCEEAGYGYATTYIPLASR